MVLYLNVENPHLAPLYLNLPIIRLYAQQVFKWTRAHGPYLHTTCKIRTLVPKDRCSSVYRL